MEILPRAPHRATRTGLVITALASIAVLGACSDDDGDVDDELTDLLVDEQFPGDTFDAVCDRLETAEGTDDTARAAAVLDELIALGGRDVAVETLELSTVDRCPDWADAVTAAVEQLP